MAQRGHSANIGLSFILPTGVTKMPWINLTVRRGALAKPVQHAVMAKLTEVLMWWEKVPDTPVARGS
jgi:hypothetical protein